MLELGRHRRPRARLLDGDGLDPGRAASATRCSCSARDRTAAVRGVLHFVPCYGRRRVSLSFMRRDPDTPNGLTEFLVSQAVAAAARARHRGGVAQLRDRGAVHAQPRDTRSSALIGRLAQAVQRRTSRSRACTASTRSSSRAGSRATRSTRAARTPARMSLAAMWAEGQLPKPALPKPVRRGRLAPGAAARIRRLNVAAAGRLRLITPDAAPPSFACAMPDDRPLHRPRRRRRRDADARGQSRSARRSGPGSARSSGRWCRCCWPVSSSDSASGCSRDQRFSAF